MRATNTEFRLVSAVPYRRRPITWAQEFTQKVACQSSTVDQKKPTTRPLQPPMRKHTTPAVHGPSQSLRFRKRSSGKRAKSWMPSKSVSVFSHERIHPQWLHQKPRRGECGSRSLSVYLWWVRWLAAHHNGPFWVAVNP